MPNRSGPYKNSIWERDSRYVLDRASLSAKELETIARLSEVDVAKKQVPPVPALSLLAISSAAKKVIATRHVKIEDVQEYLDRTLIHHGAGIATVICMLAVESNGRFPPMDRKFAAGLRAREVISAAEEKHLTAKKSMHFCRTYVEKVIPAWRESRRTRTPMQADNYWGRGGVDEV